MRASPRPRRRSRRRHHLRRSLYWPGVTLVAILSGASVAATFNHAEDQARAWGERRRVAVARDDLSPGDRLSPSVLSWEERPVAVVPPGAVDDPNGLDGRVVMSAVAAGETLLDRRLGPAGTHVAGIALPPASRALTLPPKISHPPVVVGDRLDLLAAASAPGAGTDPARPDSTRRTAVTVVATGAVVVEVDEQRGITVAVAQPDVPATAEALLAGSVVVALGGPG